MPTPAPIAKKQEEKNTAPAAAPAKKQEEKNTAPAALAAKKQEEKITEPAAAPSAHTPPQKAPSAAAAAMVKSKGGLARSPVLAPAAVPLATVASPMVSSQPDLNLDVSDCRLTKGLRGMFT